MRKIESTSWFVAALGLFVGISGVQAQELDVSRIPHKGAGAEFYFSPDGEMLIVRVGASDNPGSVWYVDLGSGFRKELGEVAPWLRKEDLAEIRSFRVSSQDGPEVEALGPFER